MSTVSEESLPPVRSPSQRTLGEESVLTAREEEEGQELPPEMRKLDPLPPISPAEQQSSRNSKESGSEGSQLRPPRILAFRRETDASETGSVHSSSTPRSPSRTSRRSRGSVSETPAVREEGVRMRYDGVETGVISIPCQTDWSYLAERAGSSSSRGRASAAASDDGKEDEGKASRGSSRGSQSTDSAIDLPLKEYPESRMDDTYGIPLFSLTSESEFSTDEEETEEAELRRKKREEKKKMKQLKREKARKNGTLPGVGPPQILQYQRESDQVPLGAADPATRSKRLQFLRKQGESAAATVGETLSFSLGEQGSDESRDVVKDKLDLGDWNWNRIASQQRTVADSGRGTDISDDEWKELMTESGIFEGMCEFCGHQVKPFPTLEEQERESPETLYCCEEYKDFVAFSVNHAAEIQKKAQAKPLDVKPHPPYGSKQARRAAKERAAQRMREREVKRQQEMAAGVQAGNFYSAKQGGEGKDSTAFSAAAVKSMKTVSYQLSSLKCLEEGWTIRPPTPLADDDDGPEIFMTEPMLPASFVEDPMKLRERPLIEKYYDHGSKFLTLFPDGSGNVFYPSGRLAILISSAAVGQYSYSVYEDDDDMTMLAFFLPSGLAGSYFRGSNNLRLHLDQLGGVELDVRGSHKRKWSWTDHSRHVHAPPYQPICFSLTSHMGLRVIAQDNVALSFSCGRCSCRFNVGTRLKLIAPDLIPEAEPDEDRLYLADSRDQVQMALHKIGILLKFPKSPKLGSVAPPQYLGASMERKKKIRFSRQRDSSVRPSTQASQATVSVN